MKFKVTPTFSGPKFALEIAKASVIGASLDTTDSTGQTINVSAEGAGVTWSYKQQGGDKVTAKVSGTLRGTTFVNVTGGTIVPA
jgi:hypothetical protein